MPKYDAIAATALRLITKKGRPAVFTRKVTGTLNPITDTSTGDTTLTETLQVVGLPMGGRAGKTSTDLAGTLVRQHMTQFHCARLGSQMEPSPGDIINWQGFDWSVIWSETYDPAADGAIYTLVNAER